VDTQQNIVNLGNSVIGSEGQGCFWYPVSQELSGKTMRAYFEFEYRSGTGDGFTFALMRSSNSTDVYGGSGHALGYGRRYGSGADYIPGNALAIEFDTYFYNGPGVANDPSKNHIAVVRDDTDFFGVTYAQNIHGQGNTPGCNDDNDGDGIKPCKEGSGNWPEDGKTYKVRVEVHTGCDNNCNTCNQSGNKAFVKMWIWQEGEDCQNCEDLNADYQSTTMQESINHCFELPSDLNNVKFGFTEGTWGVTQEVIVSNFGIGFYD